MTMVDGLDLHEWKGVLFDPADPWQLFARTEYVDAQMEAEGLGIIWNEAGRPFGVYSDQAVGRANESAAGTTSGRSTVNYQWGRYLLWVATGGRLGTPSAANPAVGPYASEHTQGKATDSNATSALAIIRRAVHMSMVGMVRTIPSESWHFAVRNAPVVSLAGYGFNKPAEQGEDEMAALAEPPVILNLKQDGLAGWGVFWGSKYKTVPAGPGGEQVIGGIHEVQKRLVNTTIDVDLTGAQFMELDSFLQDW